MTLKDYEKMIYMCFRCSYCREAVSDELGVYGVCPVYETLRWDHHTARGMVSIARAILEGKLKYSKQLAKVIYGDLMCRNCWQICPLGDQKIDLPRIVREMRKEILKSGLDLPGELGYVLKNIREYSNPFGNKTVKQVFSSDIKISKSAETLYFMGCTTRYRFPEIANAVGRIFNSVDTPFMLPSEDGSCCGGPADIAGATSLGQDLSSRNLKAFEKVAKRVITSCPLCYRTLKEEVGNVKANFDVIHLVEWLQSLIDANKLKLTKSIDATVTYHDPCELGRYCDIYEEPRKVLENIPGVKFVEMQRHGKFAWCCGGGGLVRVANINLAKKIAEVRVIEALDAGASILVTACPTCKWNLRIAARGVGKPLKVLDVAEIIAETL